MYIYSAICMCFPKSNKAQFVIEYNIWLINYSINPRQVPIDGISAVQNEKIVFINNICSINQITVPIIVMQ